MHFSITPQDTAFFADSIQEGKTLAVGILGTRSSAMWLHRCAQSAEHPDLGELIFALPDDEVPAIQKDAGNFADAAENSNENTLELAAKPLEVKQSDPLQEFSAGLDLSNEQTQEVQAKPSAVAAPLPDFGNFSLDGEFDLSTQNSSPAAAVAHAAPNLDLLAENKPELPGLAISAPAISAPAISEISSPPDSSEGESSFASGVLGFEVGAPGEDFGGQAAVSLPSDFSAPDNLAGLAMGEATASKSSPDKRPEDPASSFDPASFDFGEPASALELGTASGDDNFKTRLNEPEEQSESMETNTDSGGYASLSIGDPGEDLGQESRSSALDDIPLTPPGEAELFVAAVLAEAGHTLQSEVQLQKLDQTFETAESPKQTEGNEGTGTNLLGDWGAGGLEMDPVPEKKEVSKLDVEGGIPGKMNLPEPEPTLGVADFHLQTLAPGFSAAEQKAGQQGADKFGSGAVGGMDGLNLSSEAAEADDPLGTHLSEKLKRESEGAAGAEGQGAKLGVVVPGLSNFKSTKKKPKVSEKTGKFGFLKSAKMRLRLIMMGAAACAAACGAYFFLDRSMLRGVEALVGIAPSDETLNEGLPLQPKGHHAKQDASKKGKTKLDASAKKNKGVAKNQGSKAGSAQKTPLKKLSAKSSAQLNAGKADEGDGEVRRVVVEPLSYAWVGTNGRFFEELDEVLQRGETIAALRKFKSKPLAPFSKQVEKDLGQEYTARFFLMMGTPDKAKAPLQKLCRKSDGTRNSACLHAARALLTEGDVRGARDILAQLDRTSSEFNRTESIVNLLDVAAGALSRPSLASLGPLVTHMMEASDLTPEWYRQRTVWFARTLYSLPRADRLKIMSQLVRDRRVELMQSFTDKESAWNVTSDPLFVPLLNRVAQDFELPAFQTNNPQPKPDSEMGVAALILYLTTHNAANASVNPINILSNIRMNPLQHEVCKLVALNIYLQDHDLGQAGTVLFSRPFFSGKFVYEWNLANARYASQAQSFESWTKGLALLKQAYQTEQSARSDFFFWITETRLLRLLKKPESKIALTRAWQQALTPQEKGLAATEEALLLKGEGQYASAFAKTQKVLNQIPFHLPLLQVAAELAGRTGGDPSPFIDKQVDVPDSAWQRSVEVPPLSDVTILKLLNLL